MGWLLFLLALVLLPSSLYAQSTCSDWHSNVQGLAKAPLTIGVVAVTIMSPNGQRCGAVISNNSSQPIRCLSVSDGVPTSLTGFYVGPNQSLALGTGSRKAAACIRDSTATADAVVSVAEELP